MNFSTISKVLLASALLATQACQKKYEMVPPPVPGNGDDLDDEVILTEGLPNYFVTPFGEGEMDGTDWENAMDVEAFRALVTGDIDLSNSMIHLSKGKYLMSEATGQGLVFNKDVKRILGGYSQLSAGQDLSLRDVVANATVFSGDINANKKADAGDCGLFTVTGGHIVVDGVTFQYGYAAASETAFNSGIYVNGPLPTTIVELYDCIIKDCVSDITNNVAQGGPAVYNKSGYARLNGVDVLDNRAVGRGGAIRVQGPEAVTFLNACMIKGNSVRTMWGSGLQLSEGYVCINNTVMSGNTDAQRSTTLNGGGSFLLTSNTFVGNGTSTNMGVFRCETRAGGNTLFVNNVIVSETKDMWSVNGSGANYDVVSKGYNVCQTVSNMTPDATDVQDKNFAFASDGDYVWYVENVPALKSFATKETVINVAESFNPANAPVRNLGQVFVNWIGEDEFGKDYRGRDRNPDKLQPGAYDTELE